MDRMFATAAVTILTLTGAIMAFDTAATAQQPTLNASAKRQIGLLMQEKAARTPAQRKISSQLLYELKRRRGDPLFQELPALRSGAKVDGADRVVVEIEADVTDELLQRIAALGGSVDKSFPQYRSIRARLPLMQLEALAGSPQVTSIRPEAKAITNKVNTSQGDIAHRADLSRFDLGGDGTGTKICVISDSVDHLADVQASGDLPASIDILAGQSGLGLGLSGEGTAMLEIVHDLAPGAQLGFATAWPNPAAFAQNIRDLRFVAGCNILVDDIIYTEEPVFQDGIVAAAVDDVVADGAIYFSAAGNFGNLNDGTSAVWEGDFVDSGIFGDLSEHPPFGNNSTAGNAHDFGGGAISNQVLTDTPWVLLQWADQVGASANDYDLCVLDADLAVVIECSTNVQNGTGTPFEELTGGVPAGYRLVIINRDNAAAPRYLHLNALWGMLTFATAGQTWGHSAAQGAFSVAAVDWFKWSVGPAPFQGTEPVEWFSSDGPRRVFFRADGTAITPGDFSSSGGELRQKPDIAAADGVSTATPGFAPFFGTSAAAPHAAAIAGLALSLDPTLRAAAMRDVFATTALDIEAPGTDRDSGMGIVMAPVDMTQIEVARAVATDFNSDSMSDILWRHTDGRAAIWQMNGFALAAGGTIGAPSTGWKVKDIGDFNADNRADILWRHTDGRTVIWQMNGLTLEAGRLIGAVSTDWRIAGLGDFNGDGKADILWRHIDGRVAIWQMDGLNFVDGATVGAPSPVWEVAGIGYFDDDLKADILWRHRNNGKVVVWRMDGLSFAAGGVIGLPGTAWRVVGVGDFNGGGISDILWRHTDGRTVIWQMNGWLQEAGAVIGAVDNAWTVQRVGDYTGDGKADILWRHIDGRTVIWQMDGLALQSGVTIATVDTAWKVQ